MADYSDPKRGVAFRYNICLFAQATNQVKTTPTIAAGDFKVSKDNGATANLATLPSEAPASSGIIQVDFSATEMTADIVMLVWIDAAGNEWNSGSLCLTTAARQMADLAFPATSGRSMVVDASGLVDANAVKVGPTGSGTAQTARDIGASVLLSSGTGTGQLDFTSGVVKANLVQILATALTETAGQIAAGFKKLFDVASPVFTLLSVNQTGDTYARVGAPAGASLAADVAAVKVDTAAVKVQTDKLTFTVANQVDANVKSNAGTAITAAAGVQEVKVASIAADAITASAIAADAIGSSELATSAVNEIRDAILSDSTPFAGASIAAIKAQTDKLTFTGATLVQVDVVDWKSATAPDMTGDAYARIGAPAGASLAADLAAVKTDTANIYGKVDTEVASIISTLGTPAGASLAADLVAIAAKTANLPSDPADASDIAAAFSALQSHGDSAWTTATGFSTLDGTDVANAVWDAVMADHLDAGSTGDAIFQAGVSGPAILTVLGTPAGADLAADIAAIYAKVDTEIATIVSATSAAAIRAAVGLAAADLDTQLGDLATAVADLPTNAELATALADVAQATDLATLSTALSNVPSRLTDVWRLDGLDIANPLTVTPTTRDAGGSIHQDITGDGTTTTTVTRT